MFEAAAGSVISEEELIEATGKDILEYPAECRKDWFVPNYSKTDRIHTDHVNERKFIVTVDEDLKVNITSDDIDTAVNEMIAKKIIKSLEGLKEAPEPHVENYQKDGFN
jgi:hypothetical protein